MRNRAISAVCAAALALVVLAPSAQADFGVAGFSGSLNDVAGGPLRQAGAHPDVNTSVRFPTIAHPPVNPGEEETFTVDENAKDIKVRLPVGLIGNPTAAETCTQAQLRGSGYFAECPVASQIGTVRLFFAATGSSPFFVPLFNLVPPPGVPAQFGFNFNQARVFLDSRVTADPSVPGGYTIETDSLRTTQAVALAGVDVHLWGVPADPAHDAERVEKGGLEPTGSVASPAGSEQPLLSNPGSCSATAGRFAVEANSWMNTATFFGASFEADTGGNPFLFTGCEGLPFEPSIKAQPTSHEADSPSGLAVTVKIPQN